MEEGATIGEERRGEARESRGGGGQSLVRKGPRGSGVDGDVYGCFTGCCGVHGVSRNKVVELRVEISDLRFQI